MYHHWPVSTTLDDQIDTNKSLVHEIFSMSKLSKAYTCINFPHLFFNGTNWGYDLKPKYLLTRERYPRFPVRSEMCVEQQFKCDKLERDKTTIFHVILRKCNSLSFIGMLNTEKKLTFTSQTRSFTLCKRKYKVYRLPCTVNWQVSMASYFW